MIQQHPPAPDAPSRPSPSGPSYSVAQLLDQTHSGSSAAPIEVHVRIREALIELLRTPSQLSQGAAVEALIQAAYQRLIALDERSADRHARFGVMAAAIIRRLTVEYARARHAQDRAISLPPYSLLPLAQAALDTETPLPLKQAEALLALDAALDRLEQRAPRQARVLECRLFGRMSIRAVSRALDQPPSTTRRDERLAEAWLNQHASHPLARSAGQPS